jgi:hypothetical protein
MNSIDLGHVSETVFEMIFALMKEDEIVMGRDNVEAALKICGELENDELSTQISSKLFEDEEITKANVVSRLKLKSGLSLDFSCELSFIASHLYEFERNILEEVGVALCEMILSSECLVIENEDSLLKMIVSSGHEYDYLLCYVDCQYLTDSGICEYIDTISIENITLGHWESICRRLRHRIYISHDLARFRVLAKQNIVSHRYSNRPFDGILNSLRSSCGRNPHDAGEIVIAASSTRYNQPQQVIDYGWSSWWHSLDQANSWLQIDFKTRSVCLTHYSLKSHSGTLNWFRDWVLEGSEDGMTWDILDSRQTDELVGPSQVRTYPVTLSHYFRYIRLRQTGKTNNNENFLILTNIEVFGKISNE